MADRYTACRIYKRNGAWFVCVFDYDGDLTTDMLYDAAGNREVAKRIGREMAEKAGWTEMGRWQKMDYYGQSWTLMGSWSMAE